MDDDREVGWVLRSHRGRTLIIAGLWIAVSLAGAWWLLALEVNEGRRTVEREVETLRGALGDRAILHDAVIEGLAAALSICPQGDPTPTRQYAQAIIDSYPHIYMLGAARRVPHTERPQFEAQLHAQGFAHGIRRFAYDGDRLWHPVADKDVYYPIQMVEPEIERSAATIGLDLDAVPLFRKVVQRSLTRQGPVASAPFELTVGRRAFGLARAVAPADMGRAGGDAQHADLLALLVVYAEDLVDCPGSALRGGSCTVRMDDGDLEGDEAVLLEARSSETVSLLERVLFPRIDYTAAVRGSSQPLTLEGSRQLTFESVNIAPPLVLLLLSTVGLVLMLRLRRSNAHSEKARARAFRHLNQERASLEVRVRDRTRALRRINDELQQQVVAREAAEQRLLKKSTQLRLLARRLMDAQEQERRNLARELHDDLGQILTALRTHAQLIRQQHASQDDACVRSASTISEMAGRLYDSTHRIIVRLRPRALDELGLAGALHDSIESAGLDALGVQVHTELQGQLEGLDDAIAITMYRLLQEALTNVARHSGAQHVWIRLSRDTGPAVPPGSAGDRLHLSVEDNGRGMPESPLDKDRLGLLGAQERVEALGGSVSVGRGAAGGVLLRAEIPLEQG